MRTLEATLWAFWTTNIFEAAILKAANLAHDSDTVSAVCGQVAGAFYGVQGIPPRWLEILAKKGLIADLAGRLCALSHSRDEQAQLPANLHAVPNSAPVPAVHESESAESADGTSQSVTLTETASHAIMSMLGSPKV